MRYDVLKEHEDKDFMIQGAEGKKEPLHLVVGDVFIPAQFNYPINKREALVASGTIKLIEPKAPEPVVLPPKRSADAPAAGSA